MSVTLPAGQRWLQTTYLPHFDAAGAVAGVYALTSDITELKLIERKRDALARFDALTGLANRMQLEEHLATAMGRTRRTGTALAVLYFDIDRFKSNRFKRINDTFGHAAGDATLRIFANEARTVLREGDVFARWGGEEFILVMPDTAMPAALVAIDRIRTRIALPASWGAFPDCLVTFSAGLTMASPSQTFEQALQRADFALYEAKAQGRNRTQLALNDEPIPLDRLRQPSIA